MEYVLMSLAVTFNFVIVLWKLKRHRYLDSLVDVSITAILAFLFKGSFDGMVVAMMTGAFISLYLLANPIKFTIPKALIPQRKTIKRVFIFFAVALLSALLVYTTLKFI